MFHCLPKSVSTKSPPFLPAACCGSASLLALRWRSARQAPARNYRLGRRCPANLPRSKNLPKLPKTPLAYPRPDGLIPPLVNLRENLPVLSFGGQTFRYVPAAGCDYYPLTLGTAGDGITPAGGPAAEPQAGGADLQNGKPEAPAEPAQPAWGW